MYSNIYLVQQDSDTVQEIRHSIFISIHLNKIPLDFYHVLTIIILLSALFSYINHRFIRWPQTIGIMVLSLLTSLVIFLFGSSLPFLKDFSTQLAAIDFNVLLMQIMLGFLLFAGGFHINAASLRKEGLSIIALATVGTLLSTFIVGALAFYLFQYFNFPIPFIYCLLFGSLISPTDPIAVLGILKEAKIAHSLELKIAGESLFNDGVAVVIFLTLLEIAGGSGNFTAVDIGFLFLREAGGGIVYGLLLGYIGFLALKSIDNYKVEVLITLALVMFGYSMADMLHISGPLAMVVAGIVTGNKGKKHAMSDTTRDYLSKFWEMVDEILNAILFLLIGLEMLVVEINYDVIIIGFLMILVVLAARWISVGLPVLFLKRWIMFENHAVKILTWGGLRGGISVALALSLPAHFYRDQFVSITYVIVVFSILVQGLTIGKLASKISK